MNIPDDVYNAADAAYFATTGDGLTASYLVIAEWARKEALREVAVVVRQIPCWGDGKGNSGFDVGPDPVRVVKEAIQALADGDPS